MLRTNSKKAIQNIRNHIMNTSDFENYGINKPSTFKETADFIIRTFHDEKVRHDKRNMSFQDYFTEWMQGLPSFGIGDFYYYGTDAKTILMQILEETESEANKYTDEESCKLLTWLIYRELCKVTNYPFITD